MPDVDPSLFLREVGDGLYVRPSQEYALDKLNALKVYLNMAMTAVGKKPWRSSFYIDLQAGPGKNQIGNRIVFGSPLIALQCRIPFKNFRFNELEALPFDALTKRVSAHALKDRVKITQLDVNQAVDTVCQEIEDIDRPFIRGQYPSFNIAFLDPEGLELHWETVAKLGAMKRMDLIINVSTSGLNRVQRAAPDSGTRFFGTDEWLSVVSGSDDATTKRRKWIDLYRQRLTQLGYTSIEDVEFQPEIVARNSRNVQIYSIILASKHELGDGLWRTAVMRTQRRLPGFGD